jgi:hypothetical protein
MTAFMAKAEIHLFNHTIFVTGPWGHGPGMAAPDPTDELTLGELVRDALAYSRTHPEQTVYDRRGPTRRERRAKQAWEAFCARVAGSAARYEPEIRVEVLDLNDGLLQIRTLEPKATPQRKGITLSSETDDEVIGRVVLGLLADARPSWPTVRSAAAHTDARGGIVVYPYRPGSAAGPMRAAGPVRRLSAEQDEGTIATTIRAVLNDSTEATESRDRTAFDRALADVGLGQSDLAGRPMVWVGETTTGAIIVQPRRPSGGGWAYEGTGEMTIEDGDGIRVARAVRELVEDVPATRGTAPTGVGFGYKTAWLAVRGSSAEGVADAIGLTAGAEVPWREGVDGSRHDEVFVTPPTSGWVLAVGPGWFGAEPDVAELSGRLGTEVQYFATHRVAEAHTWARAIAGRLVRRVVYIGEDGTVEHEGAPTETERELGVAELGDEDASARVSEEIVMQVAAAWSLDPRQLATTTTSASTGIRGSVPTASGGRPER